jgi:hypothetical protein
MVHAPKTAFQTTTRNFRLDFPGSDKPGFVHLIGEIKYSGSILTGLNCYRLLGCQILAVQRIFLFSFSKQVKILEIDWGNKYPDILDIFWELDGQFIGCTASLLKISASFDRHWDSFQPALGISSSFVSDNRSYHLLYALFKESYEEDKTAYSLCSCTS